MKGPWARYVPGARDDQWLEKHMEGARAVVHAPPGFAKKVMDAVYHESLAGRSMASAPAARAGFHEKAPGASARPTTLRVYRRIGLSFTLTAAVLAASLLVPHGAYPTLLSGRLEAALGAGPSDAVRSALLGAGDAVQGMLGEQQIGGNQK